MYISYKRLFHLLIDRDISEGNFRRLANISAPTLGKLKHNKTITTEIIVKICDALSCQPSDIMEFVSQSEKNNSTTKD